MGLKRSLVEIVHDEGYGDSLLMHINTALGCKDMRAESIVDEQFLELEEANAELSARVAELSSFVDQLKSEINEFDAGRYEFL